MLLALPALLCLLVPAADAAAGDVPRPLQGVGFAQHLDAALPLDARFRGRSGEVRPLGRHFGQRPVVLVLGYYGCETLCPHLLHGVREVLEGTGLTAGRDFEVVVVSIDPEEGPAEARLRAAALLGGQDQGWHLLTGEAAAIDRLAAATGFGYRRDPQTGQYAHPAGFVVATPEGRISQYLLGLDYPSRDARLALVSAADGRIGNAVDQLLLACYRYDPGTGRYSLLVTDLLGWAGGGTFLALGGTVAFLRLRERRQGG